MTRTIHLGYFPWQIHFSSSHYSIIKHGFSYFTKHLPVRAFTIRGPLWSSSIFTSYQPWKNNNESYLHQALLGPLPKTLFYGSFFKGWHQRQPTLINNLCIPKSYEKSLRLITTHVELFFRIFFLSFVHSWWFCNPDCCSSFSPILSPRFILFIYFLSIHDQVWFYFTLQFLMCLHYSLHSWLLFFHLLLCISSILRIFLKTVSWMPFQQQPPYPTPWL